MAGNNIHVLKDEEIEMLNGLFKFEVKDGMILKTPVRFNRTTAYKINEPMKVLYHYRNKTRTMNISTYTIKVWVENFKDKYTLFDVQNAINKLLITYQTPNIDDIKTKLVDPESIKIKLV